MMKNDFKKNVNFGIKKINFKKSDFLDHSVIFNSSAQNKKIGIVFGKFYPLHIGHIYFIQRAYGQVNKLYIIIGYDEKRDCELFKNSGMSRQPSIKDRLRWLLQTFKYQEGIYIHYFNENGISPYPYGWKIWSRKIQSFLKKKGIFPNCIYTSESTDVKMYEKYLEIPAILVDPSRSFINISGTKIRKDPFRYWEYLPKEVRPFFVRTVAILGGESSGKSILVNKLANVFNTTSSLEYGRNYIYSHLGGKEIALQYSDYDKIVFGQTEYIEHAIKYANKIAFIDTEFITTQAFCLRYEGCLHPLVEFMIDKYRFDLVILLENNVPWISDGIRRLGTEIDRSEFQSILLNILNKNNIPFSHLKEENYDLRFLRCIDLVKEILKSKCYDEV